MLTRPQTIALGALIGILTLFGCQERQGPPAPAPAVDIPRPGGAEQPQDARAPNAGNAQQLKECNGLCGTLTGPAKRAVAYCTAAPGPGCNQQTALTLLCRETAAFNAECQRHKCPNPQKCVAVAAALANGGTQNRFVANDPACPPATPNSCTVTVTLNPAPPGGQAGSLACNCACQ
jgi:hypothetical protein